MKVTQGIVVADKLAKASKCIPCPRFWSNDIPSDVQQLVIHDSIHWSIKSIDLILKKKKKKKKGLE